MDVTQYVHQVVTTDGTRLTMWLVQVPRCEPCIFVSNQEAQAYAQACVRVGPGEEG